MQFCQIKRRVRRALAFGSMGLGLRFGLGARSPSRTSRYRHAADAACGSTTTVSAQWRN
jgi:hypothetical protein